FYKNQLNEKFDIILITWFTFNYIIETPETFLINVAKTLRPDAYIIFDLFYPKSLKRPEINDVWTEKKIKYKRKKILLKDKRKIDNEMEERLQIYEINGKQFKINTKRRYYSKKDIFEILKNIGLNNIQFIDNYDISTMHYLAKGEKTENNFICCCK
ncbi:MAG: hypothetical protein JXB50_13340, partial [Spirochaetes bacterium]|nr:hypothetical protein [Spirochaetota bacterium]